jgi:NAD(P)H-hydrate epimerase
LVLDADALNAFADEPALLVGREGRDLIITPHPGEMARLVGCTVEDLQADPHRHRHRFRETPQALRRPQGVSHARHHAR